MKKYMIVLLLLVFMCGTVPAQRRLGLPANSQFQDIITKEPWVDVRAFGAVGDGVTDDTAACQAALDFAITNGNTETYFPTGTYMVTGLTIATRQRIHGDGNCSEIKLIDNSDANILTTTTGIVSQLTIKDIRFNGNRTNQASGDGLHLEGTNILWAVIERVSITLCKDYGIYIDNANVVSITDTRIGECGFGARIIDSEEVNFTGSTIEFNDTYGIKFEATGPGSANTVFNTWFESGGSIDEEPTDYIIIDTPTVIIRDSRFHMGNGSDNGPTNSCINILTGNNNCLIEGNSFVGTVHASATNAIVLDSGSSNNMIFMNRGGSGGTVGGGTTDEDGRNYIVEVNSTSGSGINQAGRNVLKRLDFGSSDATPSVLNGNFFTTHNGTLTITAFDGGFEGQVINVISRGVITFDTTTADDATHNLRGSSVNIVTAAGDTTVWANYSADWYLLSAIDDSANNSF